MIKCRAQLNAERTRTVRPASRVFLILALLSAAGIAVIGSRAAASETAVVRATPSDRLTEGETFGSLDSAILAANGTDDAISRTDAIAKLTANDARANDHFGRSVAISGNTAIVGAPQLGLFQPTTLR